MTTTRAARIAPYGRVEPTLKVIRHLRERGLADPITPAVLERIGTGGATASRSLHALRFLGLIDEGGHHTEALERLRRARSDEYPQLVAQVLRAAYEEVFAVVDPAESTIETLVDAFRAYEPAGQRERMVWLFLALCREAGLVAEGKAPRAQSPPRKMSTVRRGSSRQQSPRPETIPVEEPVASVRGQTTNPNYHLVTTLIDHLPPDRKWTKAERERWLQAMASVLDLLVEVEDPNNTTDGDGAARPAS